MTKAKNKYPKKNSRGGGVMKPAYTVIQFEI